MSEKVLDATGYYFLEAFQVEIIKKALVFADLASGGYKDGHLPKEILRGLTPVPEVEKVFDRLNSAHAVLQHILNCVSCHGLGLVWPSMEICDCRKDAKEFRAAWNLLAREGPVPDLWLPFTNEKGVVDLPF